MKTIGFLTMAAFAATTMLATSCANTGVETITTEETGTAEVNISIAFADNLPTRAANPNATAQDVIVSTLDVFIFNAGDGTAASKGHDAVTLADFTREANNVWKLTKPIVTTAGDKRIYVGINLPATLNSVKNESQLNTALATIGGLYSNTDLAKGPAMINSVAEAKTLVAGSSNNTVSVTVSRMMAKVTATKSAAFSTKPTGVAEPKFTVTPDVFTAGNLATQTYPLKRMNGGLLITPGDVNGAKATTAKTVTPLAPADYPQLAINNAGVSALDRKSLYVPEHATSALYARSEATAAIVRARVVPLFLAKADNGVITETTAAPNTFVNPVYVISYGDRVYFTSNTTDRDAVLSVLNLSSDPANYREFLSVGGYLYAFYYVFINRGDGTSSDRLSVHRSTMYDVVIKSVKTIGQPGDPKNPANPGDMENPDQPVYELDAKLDVTVSVSDWNHLTTETELQ